MPNCDTFGRFYRKFRAWKCVDFGTPTGHKQKDRFCTCLFCLLSPYWESTHSKLRLELGYVCECCQWQIKRAIRSGSRPRKRAKAFAKFDWLTTTGLPWVAHFRPRPLSALGFLKAKYELLGFADCKYKAQQKQLACEPSRLLLHAKVRVFFPNIF